MKIDAIEIHHVAMPMAHAFKTSFGNTQVLHSLQMVHSAPSMFRASDKPGIGVDPDPEMLAAQTVNRAVFTR